MKRILGLLALLPLTGPAWAQTPTTPAIAAMVCANNTVVPTPVNGQFFYVQCDSNGKLITTSGGGGAPTGPAGGVLSGTYPNPGYAVQPLVPANNLSDLISAATARTNLGLGALATVTPGTGIATALAVNVGSAGAPVLFNGAGGTPSSLVGTNITGTAAGLTAGAASNVTTNGTAAVGQLPGTTTNDNASAGNVGEASETTSTTQAISTATSTNLASVVLTGGDYDVSGNCVFTGAATTNLQYIQCGLNTTSATLPADPYATRFYTNAVPFAVVPNETFLAPTRRISISGSTTLYLVANIGYSVSTLTGGALIHVRRVR